MIEQQVPHVISYRRLPRSKQFHDPLFPLR